MKNVVFFRKKKMKNNLREALQAAITALDDWSITFAPENYPQQRVKEANNRLLEQGTLHYIASVVDQCRQALNMTAEKVYVGDRVVIVDSSDPTLDGTKGTVMGDYGTDAVIVLFDVPPRGYHPAIVAVRPIVKKF